MFRVTESGSQHHLRSQVMFRVVESGFMTVCRITVSLKGTSHTYTCPPLEGCRAKLEEIRKDIEGLVYTDFVRADTLRKENTTASSPRGQSLGLP